MISDAAIADVGMGNPNKDARPLFAAQPQLWLK